MLAMWRIPDCTRSRLDLQPVTDSCSTFEPSVTRIHLATDSSSCTNRFVTLPTLLGGLSE